MTKHHFPLAILLAPVALCAQTPVTSPAPPPAPTAPPLASTSPAPVLIHVVLNTSLGPIELALDKTHAPISTANFLHYLDLKKLDGTNFYRALKVTPNDGLVQFGVKYPLKPIAHEPTSQTGLTNKDGAIAMARQAPGTAAGDFFIDVGDMSGLDAKPGGSGDTAGYAVFGKVVAGMDVVHKILDGTIDPRKGAANGMAGQMLAAPVKIISVKRVPAHP